MAEIILSTMQMKRGLKANLPTLLIGEPAYCTDTKEFYVGSAEGNILINGGGTGGDGDVLTFNTLTDLQTAYPNGSTQPVWITSEKSWYFWDGAVSDTTAPVLTITSGGTFTGTKSVTMSVNETADIYYTLNGTTPTTASPKYTAPLSISATTTLKAFARDIAGNQSAVQTVTYTLDTTAPADTTPPNNVTNLTTSNVTQTGVTLTWTASTSTDVASYDIFNGTTLIGNVATTSFNVTGLTASTAYTFVVKAKDTANNSASGTSVNVTTSAPAADTTAPVLTITSAATFTDTQTVNMSANETADIWYTVDGSDPVASGTRVKYSAPITLTATTTVKAYAVDTAGNTSVIQTSVYTKQNASGSTIAFDDFNRSDGALGTAVLGGTWNGVGNTTIISNQSGCAVGSTGYPNLEVGKADNIDIEMDLVFPSTISAGTISGICARVNSTNSQAVIFGAKNNSWGWINTLSGSWTVPSTVPNTFIVGKTYRLKLELRGNVYKAYVDEVLTSTYTDNNSIGLTNTKHGFCFYSSTASRGDNFIIKQA